MVAFRVERNGKVEIVPVEIREKKASPYNEEEWAKIERLSAQRGVVFFRQGGEEAPQEPVGPRAL